MTATITNTNTYQRSREASPASSAFRLPMLFWAGSVLFACNAIIAIGTWISPELRVDMYGAEVNPAVSTFKPSPFTEVVSTAAPRKVRTAERIKPVLFQTDPTEVESAMAQFEQAMPRATQQARYAYGADVDAVVARETEFPRLTAALDPSRQPVRPRHIDTLQLAPSAATEREIKPISIN